MTLALTQTWEFKFGDDYHARGPQTCEDMQYLWRDNFGRSRTDVNIEMLGDLPAPLSAVELGCGRGFQLELLAKAGLIEDGGGGCHGIDANHNAIMDCFQRLPRATFEQAVLGTILPRTNFKDNQFDVVMTSGFLIHLDDTTLDLVAAEMARIARYIYIAEYWSPVRDEVPYRGRMGMLWRGPYARMFSEMGGRVVKSTRLKHRNEIESLYTEVALIDTQNTGD